MNGVLYKYKINIWQTKYFQEIQKIKFEEKNDVSRVTRKSAILTIKTMEILKRSYISVSKMSQNKLDINIEWFKLLFHQHIHSVIYAID